MKNNKHYDYISTESINSKNKKGIKRNRSKNIESNNDELSDYLNYYTDSSSCASLYISRDENNIQNKDEHSKMKLRKKSNENIMSLIENKRNKYYMKQKYVYNNYKNKDIILSLWWKNIIDLYSDILITNICNNLSNIEIINMNNDKNKFEYLNEGVILYHNSNNKKNNKMSILRIITKEEINEKNEKEIYHNYPLTDDMFNENFKKYYYDKYKNVPIIKRYNCMVLPYYTTNSSILYCNKENILMHKNNFAHDGNVLVANKSIEGKIYMYNIKKTIERINNIEKRDEEEEKNKEVKEKIIELEKKIEENKESLNENYNLEKINNIKNYENEIIYITKNDQNEYYKKVKERKLYDGELLVELIGHTKSGKGLSFNNNYIVSNGDDKNIFVYDINGNVIKSNKNSYGNIHDNIGKLTPFYSIKTNEIYSNIKWLYDSLLIGSTYSGYFSLFDIRMKNNINSFKKNSFNYEGNNEKNINIYSMHKKLTNYEISDLDKYNNEDNNLIALSSMNNIFIFDLRYINNNLPYKIIHDNSYNNFNLHDNYPEPIQTTLENIDQLKKTDVNYFYDHSYNSYYNEDFFSSDTFIHSLFWCNIEAFNYIGTLNNKGIINLFDISKDKHNCIFTYGCKYVKLFKYNPYKINHFVSVDKNNILILFTLPNHIYMSDLDIYLKENFNLL